MTKEIKLVLLIGMSFLIVVGVLLSDHVQGVAEPQRAVVTKVGDGVRTSTAVPGMPEQLVPVLPPVKSEQVVVIPPPAQLGNDPQHPPEIVIGPGDSNQVSIGNGAGGAGVGGTGTITTPIDIGPALVGDPRNRSEQRPLTPTTNPAPQNKVYIAVEGDSLHRITKKMFGVYSKAKADLILKANPSMGPDGKKVAIGKSYVIPGLTPPPHPPTSTRLTHHASS